ncbi:MAG: (Fe-S)-binding protein [Vicinamibacteria bacterium]|nr:(Fe-S)-binding protein [Vicinamibacteria bacterium]
MSVFTPAPAPAVSDPRLPSYEELAGCIRCGRCLPVCPTYAATRLETFSPRGRLALLRAVCDARLALSAGVSQHLYHCLDCRACDTVCPPGVPIGELIVTGRDAAETHRPRPFWLRLLLRHVLRGADRCAAMMRPLRLAQALGLDRLAQALLARLPGVPSHWRALASFLPRQPPVFKASRVSTSYIQRRHRVAFFVGCIMKTAMADVSRATLHVLRSIGCEVLILPGQACCGAPQEDQGQGEWARAFARENIDLFAPHLDEVDAVVTDCAGCSAALKGYRRKFVSDPHWAARAAAFSAKVRDVTEWLDAVWPDDLTLDHAPCRATYHAPCHLENAQGIHDAPLRLLRRLAGLDLQTLPGGAPSACCGSAGLYTLTHTERSLALLDDKLAAIDATGAELVASANPGCLMQLRWGARLRGRRLGVRHVVELLAESLPQTMRARDESAGGEERR